jgi:hypothetical protein
MPLTEATAEKGQASTFPAPRSSPELFSKDRLEPRPRIRDSTDLDVHEAQRKCDLTNAVFRNVHHVDFDAGFDADFFAKGVPE